MASELPNVDHIRDGRESLALSVGTADLSRPTEAISG